jgi:hypothetical protein
MIKGRCAYLLGDAICDTVEINVGISPTRYELGLEA